MATLPTYVSALLHDFVFFSGDVQTTAIAVAITSSLCCSVLWMLIGLLSAARTVAPPVSPVPSLAAPACAGKFALVRSHSLPGSSTAHVRPSAHSDDVQVTRCRLAFSQPPSGRAEQLGYSLCRAHRLRNCNHCAERDQIGGSTARGSHDQYVAACNTKNNVEKSCRVKPTSIDLSYLSMRTCSPRIGFIGAQLVTLNLSHNCLRQLPEEIGCLRGLAALSLHFNYLHNLPRSIGNLSRLVEFNVENNFLCELPTSIGGLHRLQCLRINNNRLHSLPRSMGHLSHLSELYASFNQLTTLPDEICNLIKLTTVHVSVNPLCRLPDDVGRLVRLRDLDASSCHLAVLPPSLTRCASLVRLALPDNRLLRLPSLMGRLQQLRRLYLAGNRLPHVPASLASMPLQTLSVTQNPLLVMTKADLSTNIPEDFQMSVQVKHIPRCSNVSTLLDITAESIIRSRVAWRNHGVSHDMRDLLENVQFCQSCGRPLFTHYRRHLALGSGIAFAQKLPLYQVVCPTHSNRPVCQFIGVTSNQ